MEQLKFQIFTSNYDHVDVLDLFPRTKLNVPDLYNKIGGNKDSLIKQANNPELLTKSLTVDILIIEDDIISIMKHFDHIDRFCSANPKLKITNVVACTKYYSASAVVNNLRSTTNRNAKPRLVILDFDLQEKEGIEQSRIFIKKLTEEIIDTDWNCRFLPVSAFVSKKGEFESFDRFLQLNDYLALSKGVLDNYDEMQRLLGFHLNRPKSEKFNPLYAEYEEIRMEVGNKMIMSAINLLDRIEEGIVRQGAINKSFDLNNPSIRNKKNTGFMVRSSITTQVTEKRKAINILLKMANDPEYKKISSNSWVNVINQVCNYKLFASQNNSNLICPKI